MTQTLFLDFETFFDSKAGYSVTKMSLTEYVRNDQFKAHGFGYQWAHEGTTHWISGSHNMWAWVQAQDWANIDVVSHNVKFDGAILSWRFGVKPHQWFDTVGLARATLGNHVSGYSLRTVAEKLGLSPKGQMRTDGLRDLTSEQETELADYCKNDVEICKGIYEKLIGEFPVSQLGAMDWTVRCFLEPKLVLSATTLAKGVLNEKERREKVIAESGVDRKVLTSNPQFAELLRRRGYVVPTKTSKTTGKETFAFAKTDEGLGALALIDPKLYDARIAAKSNLLETRGASLLDVALTGTFPFDVGFSGAVQTHRDSGGSGAGGNPQNFTRGSFLREAVCAPIGQALVVGDFAAIELRVLTFLSRDPKLVDSITNERDTYSEFASEFYRYQVHKDTHLIERQFGKACILGLGYGMGATKFMVVANMTLKQAAEEAKKRGLTITTATEITRKQAYDTVNLYRATYSYVPRLWGFADHYLPLIAAGTANCLHFAPFIKVKKQALVLPSGLKLMYPNLRRNAEGDWEYDVYDTATKTTPHKLYGAKLIENICQALAGELLKEATQRAESDGLVCVGRVHDEIIALYSSEKVSEGVELLKKSMEVAPAWWPMIKLKSEVKFGPNWKSAK